jgi:hypothetical protein
MELLATLTQYGERLACPEPGCTVACWSGSTSTPADAETRQLRYKCHEVFDPLWKKRTAFRCRSDAYAWLGKFLVLPRDKAHIGMLDKD